MNLAAIDLNLLLVLHAVCQQRSATRAARHLNLTQSAVSNALARLRVLLKDPLFVRSGRGLAPTRRTLEVAPMLDAAVGQLQAVVGGKGAVGLRQTSRRFTLGCADNFQICDVPTIAKALAREMPLAKLQVLNVDHFGGKGGLSSLEIDAALLSRGSARGVHFESLYVERAVIVVRRSSRLGVRRMTRAVFNTARHIDVLLAASEPGATRNSFERFLARHGLMRQVAVTVPSFVAAGALIAETDLVACMPSRPAEMLTRCLPVKMLELPLPAMRIEVGLAWHERSEHDTVAAAFRNVVVEALKERS